MKVLYSFGLSMNELGEGSSTGPSTTEEFSSPVEEDSAETLAKTFVDGSADEAFCETKTASFGDD